MNALAASEASRILAENLRRETQSPPHRYALWEPSTMFVHGERTMLAGMLLHKAGVFPHAGSRCLEIGCGRMGWLGDLINWGVCEPQICGLELDPARVADARKVLPHADLRVGDAVHLPWEDESFDLVILSLVFTSILASEVRRLIADNVTRVLRPGGALLWYDFRVNNPRNRNVKGIRRAELLDLFPGLQGDVRSLTLAPLLSRTIVPVSRTLATLLSAIPLLRTHLLGVLAKPKHNGTPRTPVPYRPPLVESRPVLSGFPPSALPEPGKDGFAERKRTVESGRIITEPKTEQSEAAFARAASARHSSAADSCTAALPLALEAIGSRRTKAITLMYHDAVESNGFDDSGFPGSGPALYKLDVHEMEAHFHRIAALIPEPPALVSDVRQGKPGDRTPLLLTFDDGGVSAATHIADLLDRRGWRGHFLIIAGRVGYPAFLTSSQIQDLRARGHVIGTHSWSHPQRMSSCEWDVLVEEWHRSTAYLSNLIGEQITVASVSGGFYSRSVARAASFCGIKTLFTSEPVKRCRLVEDCLVLGRFRVARGMTPSTVAALCSASATGGQMKQYALWNLMKAAKAATGEHYLDIRAALLRFLDGRRGSTDQVSTARER